MASQYSQNLFCVSSCNTQTCRILLTKLDIINPCRRIVKFPGKDMKGIPIKPDSLATINAHQFEFEFELIDSESPLKSKCISPYNKLLQSLTDCVNKEHLPLSILQEVPHKWERYGDLVLLPHNSFLSSDWCKCVDLWKAVKTALHCDRIAKNFPISNNEYRKSQAVMLLGQTGLVRHLENGIVYCYDVTKCMFSSGNVTEKLRLSHIDCSNEVVVDLFAGIGYFTLTYLVYSKAKLVHACEWNSDAVKSLEISLMENRVRDRCVIHAGDNRIVAPSGVADRVNLGLIPSSECSWETACKCLKPKGGTMVVHGNVNSILIEPRLLSVASCIKDKYSVKDVWCMWSEMVRHSFHDILSRIYPLSSWTVEAKHLEKIKSYAPHIDHLVVVLVCKPVDCH
ncbi:tRNA wybutosine-synthesizing protein 2-like protein [Oopsacas minuta]|uniref:tRNA(Phe) (4-demethylwyosine(37)-C(7)) aminocarboxypropyltransferase n=1 Tax=Oopsacas minuta TaxID=111878 RepID=A0AAV7K1Z8_9METZ|nr:tRNA wybutosine-synthesizing protein 2-like protein [Oopsacas minuta]